MKRPRHSVDTKQVNYQLQRTARKSRKEKLGNLKIREIINVQHNIIEIMQERILIWFVYLKRMRNKKFKYDTGVECRWQRRKTKPRNIGCIEGEK